MFAKDFVVLERPFDEVAHRLERDPGTVIAPAIGGSRAACQRMWVRVGAAGWPTTPEPAVNLALGPMRETEEGVILSFGWHVAEGSALFERFDADLVLAPFGTDQTLLELRARYQPPAGVAEQIGDRSTQQQLAECALRALLEGVGASLAAPRQTGA